MERDDAGETCFVIDESFSLRGEPSTSGQAARVEKVNQTDNDHCHICNGPESNDMIQCNGCDFWFHYSCAKLTAEEVSKIKTYFCSVREKGLDNKFCEGKSKKNHLGKTQVMLTTWKAKPATSEQKLLKNAEYYDYDKIVKHTLRRRQQRYFLVRWTGYSQEDDTWEPEANFNNSISVLNRYLRENYLPLSKVEPIYGASSSARSFNRKNWAKMSQILGLYFKCKMIGNYSNVDLAVEQWSGFGSKDTLYFLGYESHCYVVLYIKQSNIGYIADGGNRFIDEIDVAKDIKDLLEIRLVSCRFDQQTRIDHCSSSAVLIALEMTKHYHSGYYARLRSLVAPAKWRERVVRILHKYESESMTLPALHQRKLRLVCPHCEVTFSTKKPDALRMHLRNKHKDP